mmetsp:Transcript_23061/g.48243  ORF Transcript_23061/g.48243 Transcript_23061/m.48243 type:complete len:201 (-) Transcript_23061:544-1146(-)
MDLCRALNNGRSVFRWLQGGFGSLVLHRVILHRPNYCWFHRSFLQWFDPLRFNLRIRTRLTGILHDNIHLPLIFQTSILAIADLHMFNSDFLLFHGIVRSPLRIPLPLRLGQVLFQSRLELSLPPSPDQSSPPQLLSQVVNKHSIDVDFVVRMGWHRRGSNFLRCSCHLGFRHRIRRSLCRHAVLIWNGIFFSYGNHISF